MWWAGHESEPEGRTDLQADRMAHYVRQREPTAVEATMTVHQRRLPRASLTTVSSSTNPGEGSASGVIGPVRLCIHASLRSPRPGHRPRITRPSVPARCAGGPYRVSLLVAGPSARTAERLLTGVELR